MNSQSRPSLSIIGLGWFGSALAQAMQGHFTIKGTTRDPEKAKRFLDQGHGVQVLDESLALSLELLSSEILVINIPPFRNQLKWFKSWKWNEKSLIYFISSTSVYGDSPGLLDETAPTHANSEAGAILIEEEQWFLTHFPHSTVIRFGGLFGPDRHPGRFLSGRRDLDHPQWPVNLIHLEDCVGFVSLLIHHKCQGEIFNLVYPDHPTRKEYYSEYCRRHQLEMPHFKDAQDQGKIISSTKAQALYEFKRPLL